MPNGDQATIAVRLERVRARIRDAETRFGRDAGSVALLAVSKLQPATKIIAAHAAGQTAFGESYAQEAVAKQAELRALALEWHFIGRIQSNKTRDIAASFDWLHSLCDIKHARRLDSQRRDDQAPLRVCIQVNLSGENNKAGLQPERVAEFIAACAGLEKLRIEGLMTLPAPNAHFDAQRRPFAALRELRDALARPDLPLPVLSMGMSDDLEAAVAEGATIVRVGTAIFGQRAPI